MFAACQGLTMFFAYAVALAGVLEGTINVAAWKQNVSIEHGIKTCEFTWPVLSLRAHTQGKRILQVLR